MNSDWGPSMKLSSTAVGATAGPYSPPSCETPAPCQASLITSGLEAPLHRLGAVVHATTFDGAAA